VKDKIKWIPLLFLVFVTLWLRLVNLGYSDYQGDEIKAMWRPDEGQSAIDFLYTQKKGPTEFFVSALVKLVNPDYTNEFLLRLPFTLAGIAGIYFFYRLVSLHYGKKIALYATLLLSVNGIFIGLMRIVQYQPFVILFSILTLYLFTLALQQERWKIRGIYLGVLCWTAALFSHYDGIFIAPFALYLLIRWYRQNSDLPARTRLKHLLIPFGVSALLLGAYFVPYLLSLPNNIKDYWTERITGEGGTDRRDRSSILNFELYNPILALYLYPLLGAASLLKIRKILPLLFWFVVPWLLLEQAIFDPGTHIYTYLLPAIILAAFGLEALEDIVVRVAGKLWGSRVNVVWVALLFSALAAISHLIFVDHTPEYPYEKRRILLWTIGGPNRDYKLWNFGFPYYRRWEDIREFVTTTEKNGYYATNENVSISVYYVPFKYFVERAGHYIYIHNPQSFKTWDGRDKVQYWRQNYPPVKVFEANGRVVAEVYYMPPGNLEDIQVAGY
jgi:4-amino-4-deoxy-L-arabinose transferase-like glycosyltransferase